MCIVIVYTLVTIQLAKKYVLPYLHLGIGPAWNLNNHVAYCPVIIGIE